MSGRWTRERMRLAAARIVVLAGVVLAAVGVVGARWGMLIAGIIVVGLGAALGPARGQRARTAARARARARDRGAS